MNTASSAPFNHSTPSGGMDTIGYGIHTETGTPLVFCRDDSGALHAFKMPAEPPPVHAAFGPTVLCRHFKGGEYEVAGAGTGHSTGEAVVVYRRRGGPGCHARPQWMFDELVDVSGVRQPRFSPIDEPYLLAFGRSTSLPSVEGLRLSMGKAKRCQSQGPRDQHENAQRGLCHGHSFHASADA